MTLRAGQAGARRRPFLGSYPWVGHLAAAVLFGLAYFGAALLGHALSLRPTAVATFWPASGLYVAALVLAPPRRWAELMAATAVANVAADVLVMGKPFAYAPVFVGANAVEALAGAGLMRLLAGRGALAPGRWLRDTLAVGAAALAGPVAGAAVGAGAVAALAGAPFAAIWPVWWASGALGVLVAAPLALTGARVWAARPSCLAPWTRRLETAATLAVTLACAGAVFWSPAAAARPAVLALPPLLWAALRLGPASAAAAVALLVLAATAGTAAGLGPFVGQGWTVAEQAVVLQLFLFVAAAAAQLLAATAAEREAALARLKGANAGLTATAAALAAGEAELQAQNRRLRVLAEVAAGLVAAEESEDAVLAPLFGADAAHIGFEACMGYVLVREGGEARLRLTASAGLPEAVQAGFGSLPLDGPLPCSHVAATGRALVVEDVQDSGDPAVAAARAMGLRAYAGYPVLASDGRVLGALSFGSRVRDRFAPDDLEFFQALAHLLAGAWAREAAVAALRGSETRLQDLVGTLDLASVLVRDLDGTIRFWSDGCRRLYGWTAEEAVGRSGHELFGAGFSASLPEVDAALLRDGEWSGDAVHRRRNGTEVTVAVRKVLRRDAEGRPVAVVANAADVTALRRAQAELERLNADLEGRVRAEVAAREAAQERLAHAQRMEALGQLAGGVAHDFNNVLQVVEGAAALIERRPGDAAGARRLARLALDAAGRGVAITGRLLAFSRRDVLRAEPVDAVGLLAGAREMLAHTLGAGIEVRASTARELPPLLADKGQLETVLVNLGTNARDAMSGGGVLTISATAETVPAEGDAAHLHGLRAGAYVRLTVTDTGSGMKPEVLARVTEPFFTTKPVGKGTGLGLSMAAGFAEQSGGALCVESVVGHGTTVSLWFPVAEAQGSADGPWGTSARPALARSVCGPGERAGARVLLVDDDAVVREVMAEQLEDAGFAVLVAESGAGALVLLDAGEAVDLIVSDLSMPGMDGLVLIREAQRRRPGLPAVLLTGFADADLAVHGAVGGSFSLLCKPVTGRQLVERAAALLEAGVVAGNTGRADRAGAAVPLR